MLKATKSELSETTLFLDCKSALLLCQILVSHANPHTQGFPLSLGAR
jgi:hypothetical protein